METPVSESGTTVILGRQHGDRWASFGEHAGIQSISSLLQPEQMQGLELFKDLKEDFLLEISPDVSVAKWNEGAVIFEEGTYLDLAFVVLEGEVELYLAAQESAARPIFGSGAGKTVAAPRTPPPDADEAGRTRVAPAPAQEGGTITFLSSLDFDLAAGERMRLGPGEIFGEIGALNGWPQSATARTRTPCTLLQIRLPALRKLRRKSRSLKARLDELYRSRMLRQHLAITPLLQECPPEIIDRIAQRVELVSLQPGEVVVREGEAVEHFFLVRSGFLKLSQKVDRGEVVVSYAGKGGTLGESELLVEGLGTWQTTASSVRFTELVRLAKQDFLEVIGEVPDLQRRLWDVAVERIKEIGYTKTNLRRSDLIDFTLEKGLAQANSVLVIDLETCVRCDDCVRGCASTHGGIPRFVREGEVHNGFLVARSCYHCEDPVCLVGCPTGAIARVNVGEVVAIDPALCIGCGACAENCPYDAIVMHDLDTTWGSDAMPEYLRGEPRRMASKCDLCYTSKAGPACVSSCPHGSAARVSSVEEFDLLLRAKQEAGGRA